MERYTETILNKQGKPVAGAVVTVTTYPDNEPAVIYAADGGQPVEFVSSDENGRFAFYAADGHYNLSIVGKHIDALTITDIVLNDPNDEASLAALAADDGAGKIGGTWFGGIKAKLSQLASSIGASLIGYSNTSVGEKLKQFDAETIDSKALYYRSVVREFGFRNSATDALKALYGYSYLYPQAANIDARTGELFRLLGPSGGANSWAWIQVYDLASGALKRTFTTGQQWRESLVISYEGSNRYLYTIGDSDTAIRVDITALPADMGTAPVTVLPVPGYSMMAFDGKTFAVQDARAWRNGKRRNHFTLYDASFAQTGTLTLPLDAIGTLNAYIDYFPKMQGICAINGSYMVGTGAAYLPGMHDPNANGKLQGLQVFSPTGKLLASGLSNPSGMPAIFAQKLGYVPTCIENEGTFAAGGEVYSCWITLSPDDRELPANEGRGMVIMREMAKDKDRLDFTSTAASNRISLDAALYAGEIMHGDTQITNPVTGAAMTTFQQIIDFMNAADLPRYAFTGTNQTITDLNGAPVTVTGRIVEFRNLSGATFLVRVAGLTDTIEYGINASGQTMLVLPSAFKSVSLASVLTDMTTKTGRLSGKHYNNAEEDFLGLDIQCTSSGNNLLYGGGSGGFNTATVHRWYTAPNNTTLTGTERMRLEDGRGLVLKPMTVSVPPNNGEMTFELTSNTALAVRVKGTDGVVRSATLTLA